MNLRFEKPMRIKIQDLPPDTVDQSLARRRNKPRACVLILAIVRFFICSIAFFILCYPCEVLEHKILTRVCIIL